MRAPAIASAVLVPASLVLAIWAAARARRVDPEAPAPGARRATGASVDRGDPLPPAAPVRPRDVDPGDRSGAQGDTAAPDLEKIPSADLAARLAAAGAWLQADILEELSSRRAPQTLPAALTLLASPDPSIRRSAVQALQDQGDAKAIDPLRRSLDRENDTRVRAAIREALDDLEESAEK